jgi:hypothetical protein
MKWFWAVCLVVLISSTPADAASGQVSLICTETAATTASGRHTPVLRVSGEAAIVVDFDRRLVSHGDGSEWYPIHKITDAVVTWRSEDGDLKGFFSRTTLEAGEFYRHSGTLIHRAYACRLHSYLDFNLKP